MKQKGIKKAILIDEDVHKNFKLFCKNKKLKMKPLLEELIKSYVNAYEDLEH